MEEIAIAAQEVAGDSEKLEESIGTVAAVNRVLGATSRQVFASTEETLHLHLHEEIASSARALATTAEGLTQVIAHFNTPGQLTVRW